VREINADVVRVISISLVIMFHLNVLTIGWVGVDLFLFLSGYFAKMSLDKYSSYQFVLKRAYRVTPAFIFSIAVILFASCVLLPSLFISENLLFFISPIGHVFNILLYHKDFDYFNSVNWALPTLHLWSLSLEVQLYFFIAVLYPIISKLNSNILHIIKWFIPICFYFMFFKSDISAEYFNPIFRSYMFFVGFSFLNTSKIYTFFTITLYSLIIGSVYCYILLLLPFLIGINIGIKNLPKHVLSTIKKLAHYSYEVYLIHWPIICFYNWYV
jgi:peptidoglycan/LPS O-acetylase OafA/YrhL